MPGEHGGGERPAIEQGGSPSDYRVWSEGGQPGAPATERMPKEPKSEVLQQAEKIKSFWTGSLLTGKPPPDQLPKDGGGSNRQRS